MEDTKPVEEFTTSSSAPPQQDHPPPVPTTHSNNKNRKLTNANLCNSSYFKIRALLRQLRPLFIQVLQTPDFRNCKAARELQIQMKLLMSLYKEMTMEIDLPEKPMPKCQPFSGENVSGRLSWERNQDGKLPEILQSSHQSAEKKPPMYFDSQTKLDDSHTRKSYIVGGSAFGWNFITFRGGNPVYYGVTKEHYRNNLKRKMSGTDVSSCIS